MNCELQDKCNKGFQSILRQQGNLPSEYGSSDDEEVPGSAYPAAGLLLSHNGSGDSFCSSTAFVGAIIYLTRIATGGGRAKKVREGGSIPTYRVKTNSRLFQSDGCGFDPEQFVGASVTREFYTKVFTLKAFPFILSFWGDKRGALWNVFPKV